MCSSAFMFWEITTRSNVYTYSILVAITLDLYLKQKTSENYKFYTTAILVGIILSTRSIFILSYIVFFIPDVVAKDVKIKKVLSFLLIAIISYFITFLPLIILFRDDFFVMNPFIVQSSFLVPKIYIVLFIILSVGISFCAKNDVNKFFYSGISLFLSIFIYAIYHLVNFGYKESFVDSRIDISYFIFCIPFFVIFLSKNVQKCNIR